MENPTSQSGEPAAAPRKRGWRRACGCCLGFVSAPVLVLLILAIWLSLGPAPAPADCLPPEAPVKLVARDPAGLAEMFLNEERWRPLREKALEGKPPPGRWQFLGFKLAIGKDVAIAPDDEDATVVAMRPGMLFRAFERVLRLTTDADADGVRRIPDGDLYYGIIGRTLIASKQRDKVAAVLARRDSVLKADGDRQAARDDRVELRFAGDISEGNLGHKALAFVLDLPSASRCEGWLRTDRDIRELAGQVEFAPEASAPSANLPPPLPSSGPASAKLVSADALGYWAWQAPPGEDRWQAVGRFMRLEAVFGGTSADLDLFLKEARKAGIEPARDLAPRLAGERAIAVVGQPGPGGKPLLPALCATMECADPKAAWPAIRGALEAYYRVPIVDEPPVIAGKAPDPWLLRRNYRGVEVVEVVYACYPWGSGFRPAYAMAGKFAAYSTSRAELERMIDRAAGRDAGASLAGSELLAPRAGNAWPSGLLVLRPQGRGREFADLALALGNYFSAPGREPGPEEEKHADVLAAILSVTEELRLEWLPADGGRIRLEIEGRLAR